MLLSQSLPLDRDYESAEVSRGQRRSSGTKKKKNSRVWEQINDNAAGVDAGAEFH